MKTRLSQGPMRMIQPLKPMKRMKAIGKRRPFMVGSVCYRQRHKLLYDVTGRLRQYSSMIRQHMERRRDDGLGSQLFFLRQLRTTRVQKELAETMKTVLDQRLKTELHYFRSRPTLTAKVLRQLAGPLQHSEQRPLTHADRAKPAPPVPPTPVNETPPPQQTTIIREEFVMPPWLMRDISEQAAEAVWRKLALEQLRLG